MTLFIRSEARINSPAKNDDQNSLIIKGKIVSLRPIKPEEAALAYHWFLQSDPESQSCHKIEIIDPDEYASRVSQRKDDGKSADFLIVATEDGRPVGRIRYFDLNDQNRSAEIGYITAPKERKMGYAHEAVSLILKFLFEEKKLNKVYAQTGDFNQGSKRLLESVRFSLDGRLREHHLYRGQRRDDLVYSILIAEYMSQD